MSHIRGVKVESRIIVPISPPKCGTQSHQYRPLVACATSRAGAFSGKVGSGFP
jgi:hypothetical protein